MKFLVQLALFSFLAVAAQAQIQVELKFKRLQYVASEPVMATVKITNLAGRDIDLHDETASTGSVLQSMPLPTMNRKPSSTAQINCMFFIAPRHEVGLIPILA